MKYFIRSLRPSQWVKNLLVFAALVFAGKMFHIFSLINSTILFFAFCLTSGSGYILNDIYDRNKDQNHPEKKNRPIASGKISVTWAFVFAIICIIISLALSYHINFFSFLVVAIYLLLMSGYTLIFKHIPVLDITIIAIGFVLRAVAGAFAIEVEISSWLLLCTFFLALFLIIGKRRYELILMEDDAKKFRHTLGEYNIKLLDQLIAIVTAICVVAYSIYTLDNTTVNKFNTHNLIYTVPIVIIGIFRYLNLIYAKNEGGSPERILISDTGILFSVLVWLVLVSIIIY